MTSRQTGLELAEARKSLDDNKRQALSLAERITILSQDLLRVQKFDSKLRTMMNMEKEPTEVENGPGDFSRILSSAPSSGTCHAQNAGFPDQPFGIYPT